MPTNSSATDIAQLDSNTAIEMPMTVRVLPNNRLVVGYINSIWRFDLNQALSGSEAKPGFR